MDKNNLVFIALAFALFATGGFLIYKNGSSFLESAIAPPDTRQINPETLARCLAAKKVTMYGARWCVNCESQKKTFGESWKNVPYIDCSQDGNAIMASRCRNEHIRALPTWVFPGNLRKEGEFTLKEIAGLSGCGG